MVKLQMEHKLSTLFQGLVAKEKGGTNLYVQKKTNPSNECVEDAKVMSFTEIKNLYFDAVIEKTIRRQYKNMISWSFNGKAPCERDSVKLLSVLLLKWNNHDIDPPSNKICRFD